MKQFAIWNREMRRKVYRAETAREALLMAVHDGHIQRMTNYRKYEEVRDEPQPI